MTGTEAPKPTVAPQVPAVSGAARAARTGLALLAQAMDELSSVGLDGLDDQDVRDGLRQIGAVRNRLDAQATRWVSEMDRRRAFVADGHRTARDWLANELRLDKADAGRRAKLAQRLVAAPQAAAAFAAGTITAEHASTIARAVDTPEVAPDPDAAAELERHLLAAASSESPARVAREARRRQIADAPDRGAAIAKQQFDRRRAHLTELADGMVKLEALLTPEAAEYVTAAVEPLCPPDTADVPEPMRRTVVQKRHDALVALAKHALDTKDDLPQRGGRAAQALVIVDQASLADPDTVAPEVLAQARVAELANSGPVPDTVARRMTCDSHIRRVVLNSHSEAVDIGRQDRACTVHQRLAVLARDGCCQGCGGPVAYVEIHHIIEWEDGGPTDLHNLVALCWPCHHGIHDANWTLRRAPDGTLEFLDPHGTVRRRRRPPDT